MSDKSKKPSHVAYHVREVGDDTAYFNRIGSAFAHKDGQGFNILLDAVPVDGKVTLRTPAERLEETRASGSSNRTRRRERRADFERD